jgi:aspartyl-tRNA(Asn)/glutamyl-tRNA(Gln) amidotransferase subunit A
VLQGAGFEQADDVNGAIQNALAVLRDDGAELVELDLPSMEVGFGAWKVIMHAEASTYHRPFLSERPEAYADSVRIQLEAGRCLSATDYLAAQQYRALFNREVYELLGSVSALVTPTLPVTAPQLGQSHVTYGGRETTSQDAMTCITWLANFTGLPAVTVPCGFGANGLPVGLSMHGRAGSDFWLLNIASRFQTLTDWHLIRPLAGTEDAAPRSQ